LLTGQCMGRGTYTHIPRHVSAATRTITLRFLNRESGITRPFDRIATESVLYQVFLIATGLWSEDIPLGYNFDQQNWLKAERLLDKSPMFPGSSTSLNSPILGVPVSFFRLAVCFKNAYQTGVGVDSAVVKSLRLELAPWEKGLLHEEGFACLQLSKEEQPNRKHTFYRDCTYLFILCLSMLLDQLAVPPLDSAPWPAPSQCWQLTRAIAILRSHVHDAEWHLCFMLNWPVYTLGFFLSSPEHIELVRSEMEARWRLQKFAQLVRFGNDLESAWAKRGLATGYRKKLTFPGSYEKGWQHAEEPP
jgi:hypothetical protein